MTRKIICHIFIPALLSVVFFGVAAVSVDIIGGHVQGLSLLTIAFIGALAALCAGVAAVKRRMWGGGNTAWWVVTSLILAIPAIALMGWA